MKKSIFSAMIASVALMPLTIFAQVTTEPIATLTVEEPALTVEVTDEATVTVDTEDSIVGPIITIIAEVVVETSNSALDVTICGQKFIYTGGTYDQNDNVIKSPICTAHDVVGISVANVEFSKVPELPKRNFNVNFDGKIAFSDKMEFSELMNKVIAGATDSQLYAVDGGEGFTYLRPISDTTANSLMGSDYKDKVVYFDDSIVYTYKIVR